MIRPGSTLWLARHEARLSWRDWIWLITGGHSRRAVTAGIIFVAFVLFLHALAYVMLGSAADRADMADPQVLLVITGSLAMSSSLMLSQALESVTRGFYARGDLDLILASPVSAWRLFAVRITAMAAAVAAQSLVLAAPFVNVLVWRGGAHWLGAYAVTVALAMDAVAISVAADRRAVPRDRPAAHPVCRADPRRDHRRRVRHRAPSSRRSSHWGRCRGRRSSSRRRWPGSRPTAAASSGGRPAPSSGGRWRWLRSAASA